MAMRFKKPANEPTYKIIRVERANGRVEYMPYVHSGISGDGWYIPLLTSPVATIEEAERAIEKHKGDAIVSQQTVKTYE